MSYQRISITIENATDAIFRFVGGHPVKRHGTPIRGARYNWRVGRAINRWIKRRDDRAMRRLIDDDHTQRVGRITEMRAALAREETAHVAGLLRTSPTAANNKVET